MTEKNKSDNHKFLPSSALSAFHLEANRSRSGMTVTVGGIIGISDYSDTGVLLMSHGGRICILGKRLKLCVYENNTLEISGKVEDIKFSYGKN